MTKRKSRDLQYEGDSRFVLPLMYVANVYETLVNEVNMRLSSLDGMREKTIGVALEAAGGLYRKLAKKFPKKGIHFFYEIRCFVNLKIFNAINLFVFVEQELALLKDGNWQRLSRQDRDFLN